jgi:CRP/FNR family transcriptional regulator, nitrogen oxide reductase regulator
MKKRTRPRTTESVSEFRAINVPHDAAFLYGLEPQEIDVILAAAKPFRFSAERVMTYQGRPADRVLLLWKGRARYFFDTPNGKKLILRWITPGEIFGPSALVDRPTQYIVSSEAVRDSVVLVWPGETIRALSRRFPPLWENAFFVTANYISWYVAAHAALTSQSARERLAYVLLELAPRIGEKVSDNLELEVTNEELAYSANITPYTTSRLISEWRRIGVISKRYGRIFLCSPEKLFTPPDTTRKHKRNVAPEQ